jgi:hypothetical protein
MNSRNSGHGTPAKNISRHCMTTLSRPALISAFQLACMTAAASTSRVMIGDIREWRCALT